MYNQLDELTYDLQQGFVDDNDNSDEECFLDVRKNTEFYTEVGADWVIFRGVKLHIIQSVDDYRINDKVVFMYVNDPNGEISVEQRLAVLYELQESYPYHNMMVCIRGVKSTVDINSMYHAHYFRDLNVLQYRSGFSKLLTE